jgi:hypothetical protein
VTLVPSPDGLSLSLVCDSCGQSVKDIESRAEHWSVVWAVITRTGWTGSPLAIGPHHCAECASAPVRDVRDTAHRPPSDGPWTVNLRDPPSSTN